MEQKLERYNYIVKELSDTVLALRIRMTDIECDNRKLKCLVDDYSNTFTNDYNELESQYLGHDEAMVKRINEMQAKIADLDCRLAGLDEDVCKRSEVELVNMGSETHTDNILARLHAHYKAYTALSIPIPKFRITRNEVAHLLASMQTYGPYYIGMRYRGVELELVRNDNL